jgi:serine/threonine protein kinase
VRPLLTRGDAPPSFAQLAQRWVAAVVRPALAAATAREDCYRRGVAETTLIGTVLDGRYQVIEAIAEGAMGSVYRGERLQLGRAVAIKVMHQELPDELASRQRFEREAKLMALLEHPNCVSVIDYGLHDEKPYLVMDLVRGTSLIELLDRETRLEVGKSCDVIRQVLAGLAHAHELGIVHRDIKPANIMISEKAGFGQQVRILDFGLARLTEGSTKLTTGIVVGTPNYMAPEQCKGSDVDARTDLYACGVVLFEMLTGRKPFVANDPIQVVRKHLTERPPTLASALPNVDFGDLEQVIAKSLAKAPADRYASAVEMAKAIEIAAQKATKMSAGALFARAVPETASSPGMQQATMSGWNVPQEPATSHGLGAVPPSPGAVPPSPSAVPPSPGAVPPSPGAVPPSPGAVPPSPGAVMSSAPPAGVANPAAKPTSPSAPRAPQPPAASDDASILLSDSSLLPMSTFMEPANAAVDHNATTIAPPPVPAIDNAATTISPPPVPPIDNAATTISPPPTPPSNHVAAPRVPVLTPSTGAPNRALDVPPTRPSTTAHPSSGGDRPIPTLPLTKKHLIMIGGGVVALIVIIALVAGGGSSSAKKTDTKAGDDTTATEPPSDPLPQVLERANAQIASEDYEAAVGTLRRARKAHPDNAELAFLSGKANFGRLWWTDGIDDFRAAIELDAGYKENPELLKTVLKGFITTPDVGDRIVELMREIGPPFRPYLEETAEKHPKKAIRARARAELNARP